VKERLRHLTILNQTSADIKISELQQQHYLLANVEADLDKMDVGHHLRPEMGEEDPNRNASLEEAVSQGGVPMGAGLVVPDDRGESTTSGDLHVVNRAGVSQVDATGQLVTQVFTSHLYQRLPHPLSHFSKRT
jgi:hypothetical protein